MSTEYRPGEAVVLLTVFIILGIVGYKVCGWWVPGTIIASYVLGTFVNYYY